jgi:hypothetical protein
MTRHLIAGKVLPWRRFWTPLGGHLSAGHDGRGFMDDPEDDFGRAMNPEVHLLSELLPRSCLVLAGQPGIGKTTEVETLAEDVSWLAPNEVLIQISGRLATSVEELRRRTVDSPRWKTALAEGRSVRLLFDGVDEALKRVSVLVPALADWLKDEPCDRVKVILVCRAAEWHVADGQALSSLWEQDTDTIVYELCPLRWKDAQLAAVESGVDPEILYRELTRHRVAGLAARPITLRLLLEEMRRGGTLPGSHHELFSRAISRLCEEVDEERARHLPTPRPRPAEIGRVAARIAAMLMLGGRNVVLRNGDEVDASELSTKDIAVGHEMVDGVKVAVTPDLVSASLDTPLFSLRGPERYGFDHLTFAEHLAADYLREGTISQLRRLLSVSFQGREFVAPQLAEVAARVSTKNPAWCDHLISTEPELLLRADASPLTDHQRERAVESLLRRAEHEEAFDEVGTGSFYHTLRHPRLAQQLRPYIENTAHNPVVRRMAIEIAGDAGVAELEPLLWERIKQRDPAFSYVCAALRDLAGAQSENHLMAALQGELPDDGSLKDVALQKLVPMVLPVRAVIPFIVVPPVERFTFAYGLSKHLVVEDLPIVLKAMAEGHLLSGDADGLRELAARTFEMAMDNLHCAEVAHALANYWRSSARLYFALPSKMMREERDPLTALNESGKRRVLAKLVLTLPDAEAHDINYGQCPLVRKEDAMWMLEELPNVPSASMNVWAKLCAQQMWQDLPPQVEGLLCKRYAEWAELRAILPKTKRFDIATTLRRLRRAHELRTARTQARNQRRFRRRSRTERLAEVWAELETNDTVWVGFCACAFQHEESDVKFNDVDRGDITDSPAWRLADEHQRAGLRNAARRFLVTRRDGKRADHEWTNYCESACYAIGLLRLEVTPGSNLGIAVSTRWPRVVFDEIDHGSATRCAAVAAVYQLVPEVAAKRFAKKLRHDNRKEGYMVHLRRYVDCWDARLVGVVRKFLLGRGVQARSIRQTFKFLDEHDPSSAITMFDEVILRRGGFQPIDERGRALLAVGLFLLRGKRWDASWEALRKCSKQIARQVFLDAAHELIDRETTFDDALSVEQLIRFCGRVCQLFPISQYSEHHDAHGHVSSKHMMPEFRGKLTAALVNRASPEACAGLLMISSQLPPDERIWMRWRYHEGVKNVLSMAWTARRRASGELLAMMRDARKLTVDSADDLLEAVLASLERLQHRLKNAESTELRALWNEPGRGAEPHPKEEAVLSNVVHDWLQRDLGPGSGIILNREVQATRLGKLDIKIEAFSAAKEEPVTLVIEVKGDWHRKIKTALGDQLVKQYLIPNGWTHGVFLVGWFGPVAARKSRAATWPPENFEEAEMLTKSWEKDQCPIDRTARGVVLDCVLRRGIGQ